MRVRTQGFAHTADVIVTDLIELLFLRTHNGVT
jgi:hypothetical protein